MTTFRSLVLLIALFVITIANAQEEQKNAYQFTNLINLSHTPVKDQYRSGTCWSYATASFLESELLRLGKGSFDLSEMFFVYHGYDQKAERYVRYHGAANFGPGGQAHDVINIMRTHGLATQDEYAGLIKGDTRPEHGELDAVLEGFLKAVVANKGGKISPVWHDAYRGILNAYLGEVPVKAKDLADKDKKIAASPTLGLNPDDYIELTSYIHHPFYTRFALEIPDNWSNDLYYNVPADELINTMYNSLEKGYTICWDGDVSDKGFSHKNGIAIIPEMQPVSSDGTEMEKWEKMTEKEKNEMVYNFTEPRKEKEITQEMRQQAFDNYQATDDHLMHMVGLVKDQNGKKYFVTKNSWNENSNSSGGLLNISEAYVRLNTIAIMVHKEALSKELKNKLGIE